ncbi:MAG: lipoprotein-releasing ABC transporter permease subunit [Betaproteobacteria bacterium]|nr:lipoprotein-releasing ABC transporter permease subunit [Betaproteobacteria bacterium]
MKVPFELEVGWRYTRSGRAGRRNGFISFISGVSMLGIALGVAALIIVLSVMNGFQKEVRNRMLGVIPHVELMAAEGQALPDWQAVAQQAARTPGVGEQVQATAPYVVSQVLLARGQEMRGVVLRGVDPVYESGVTELARRQPEQVQRLVSGQWQVLLGAEIARQMGVGEGSALTLITPGGQVTPAGVLPRLKTVRVAGLFESGHYEFDSTLVLMHLEDAARLMRVSGPTGVQLRLQDQQAARAVAAQLQQHLGPDVVVRDWTRTNPSWFDAVQLEKRLMFIILTLIVAVAAFNLVSTLVMTVTDKQADIAILRTLGASPRSIMAIFMVQGATTGVAGTAAGVGLGLLVAFHVDTIVPALEGLLSTKFLPASIYVISRMPSDPQWGDIVPIALVSLVLAFLATLYPSWRASRVQPAQALRHE